MENAPCMPPKNKGGRPRMAFDDLKPGSKRSRRSRDPNICTVITVVEAQPRTPTEPARRGRPLLPYDELTAEGRRKPLDPVEVTHRGFLSLLLDDYQAIGPVPRP